MSSPRVHLVSIAPPFRGGLPDLSRPPSALLYVGGYLKRHGFSVRVHHLRESELERAIDDVCRDPEALFAGFSVMTGRQVTTSAEMSARLKALRPELPVVWGGIHPSLLPEACLAFGCIDFAVVGEGERTALELATWLTAAAPGERPVGMEGVSYRQGDEFVAGPPRPFAKDLDEFRQDWALVEPDRYVQTGSGRRTLSFITSRGCPHSCGFCYNQRFNRRRWRCHSADFVVNEVLALRAALGIDTVVFDDDNFFTDRARGLEILRRLKAGGVTSTWLEVRVDYLTEDLLSHLVELGVQTIFVGWESGSPVTLARIAKGFTPALIREKARLLARYPSLHVDASAIVGFPWETDRDIGDTVALLLEMARLKPGGFHFNLGVYVPYPGAPVTEDAQAAGFRFPEDPEGWSAYDILAGTMPLPWMSAERLRRLTRTDQYAKLLHVPGRLGPVRTAVLRLLAALAGWRLRRGWLGCPWEVRFMEWYASRRYRRPREGSEG